jgi:glucose-1-phosphate adenylyltransferase
MSLHRHINAAFKFDNVTPSFGEILAAQQTPAGSHWYQGTADAVRQNLHYFLERPFEYYVILSGDQLYRMDYRQVLRQHVETDADLTVGTIPIGYSASSELISKVARLSRSSHGPRRTGVFLRTCFRIMQVLCGYFPQS